MNVNTPLHTISRIGPSTAKKLHKLGIKKVEDLLFHFPARYEDFSRIVPIASVLPNVNVTVVGTVGSIKTARSPRRRMFVVEATVQDRSDAIKAVWFNQHYLAKLIKEGDTIALSGKATISNNELVFNHPNYQTLKTFDKEQFLHTGRLIPIYPETSGISSRWFRFMIKTLSPLFDEIPDPLPKEILTKQNLIPISTALKQIHFPDSLEEAGEAKKRFAFEDLFLLTLAAQKMRKTIRSKKAPAIPFQEDVIKRFVASLPFTLTDSQRKAAWEILLDIAKPIPMNRLLEGDVGSGKTVVATIAILNCVSQRYQAVLMAPTEILAHQHFKTIAKILPQKYTLAMVTGSMCKLYSRKLRDFMPISRQKLQKRLLDGTIDIVIGTHSLISEKAQKNLVFKNLALAVVDEQHRFGVEQRARLTQKKSGAIPHFLSMTATPMPRTLALTVFGDLDISILDEMPTGRKKIETKLVTEGTRNTLYQFIKREIASGRQAFVVCPLIEESEKLQTAAATKEYERLKERVFSDLSVGLLHGKMKPKDKDKALQEFKEKKTHVLVTTPVVEVGIDIPNATIMVIEGAERFGLAQLHQLRGRVGRAEHQSYCFLLADAPTARLRAMVTSSSGFELAKKDLELRGPGDFYGTRQWGIPDIAMQNLGNVELVQQVRQEAIALLKKDMSLLSHRPLKQKAEKIMATLHLE